MTASRSRPRPVAKDRRGWGAVGVDPLQPVVEFVAAALGEDLGELADPVTGDAQRRTAIQDRIASATLVTGEAVRMAG